MLVRKVFAGLLRVAAVALVLGTWPGPASPLHPDRAQAQTPLVDDELVYIDPGGVLRVKDFSASNTGRLPVTWYSPTGGYIAATVIDVQGDGDMEIAALSTLSGTYSLDIYDPVIASGAFDPAQTIGDIPWRQLYHLPLEHTPRLLVAAELDPGRPGDEILFIEREERPAYLREVGPRTGTAWERVRTTIDDDDWTSVAAGDMDLDGLDEIALVQKKDGIFQIWRMTTPGAALLLYENRSENQNWQDAAMGEWRGDGRQLVGAVRSAPRLWTTFLIFRYSLREQAIRDDHSEVFTPGPRFIMFGDVNGSGDDEAFMLRELPASENRARLIGRNRNADALALTEDVLDAASDYLHGATGDIDADGKDEVILLGRSKLRRYMSPDTSTAAIDEELANDGHTLVAGDLDAAGYLQELVLRVAPSVASTSAPAGDLPPALTFSVTTEPTGQAIPFTAAISGNAPWLTLTSSGATTPATLTASVNSTRLTEGTYVASILLTSPHPLVFTQPVSAQVILTVRPGLLLQPPQMLFVSTACESAGEETRFVKIVAPTGSPFTVAVVAPQQEAISQGSEGVQVLEGAEGAASTQPAAPMLTWPSSVPWASAASATAAAPDTLSVSVNYALRDGPFQMAKAIVTAQVNGATFVRTLPITLFCAQTQVLLPVARK